VTARLTTASLRYFRAVVNFTDILGAVFECAETKSAKNTDNLTVFFGILGSEHIKAVRKMLMKLTHVVNFTNILQTAFVLKLFYQKITKPNCNDRKASKNTFEQKVLNKILIELTHVVNFTNIL